MNIALLAHDNKKELMTQFCVAYSGVLAQHDLYAPATTGKLICSTTGVPVTLFLPCAGGGSQQIGHRIVHNEIDMVLFFCDPSGPSEAKDMENIARLCDRHTIPFATNIATAEMLIHGLEHGDLDWRIGVRSSVTKKY